MKKVLQRILAIACMVALTVAVLPAAGLRADDKPGKPKISVKAVNDTDVEITIGKTDGAAGYEIWITSDCGYVGYKNENYFYGEYSYEKNPGDYINAATIEEDGTEVRTVTIKNLSKASVSVKVRAYKGEHYMDGQKDNDPWNYGDFSKAKKVKVTAQKKGYKTSYNFSKVKKGDTIKFGTYEQSYPVDGKDPIEWVVLEKIKDEILVMSKYALECLPYNTKCKGITWEKCTLRKWLNEKFYKAAFNKAEKAMIKKTKVQNKDNPEHETQGGNDTKDKVFLLSHEDILKESYGFNTYIYAYDINRECAASEYAGAQGASLGIDKSCLWWLRSPGSDIPGDKSDNAEVVYSSGMVSDIGQEVDLNHASVRPVMVLKLKS